jgi:transcriptional regulator with XRE-family HTH domain
MGGEIVDYDATGQRIRRIRKVQGISQEILAEKTGISTTHMSDS